MKKKIIFIRMRMALCALLVLFSLSAYGQKAAGVVRWKAGNVATESQIKVWGMDSCFVALKIDDATFARMQGKSWKANCTLHRDDLRYVRVLHRNADGKPQMGELVVDRNVVDDVLFIFRKLYDADYRIERMCLIDDYDADDERSMSANNTSCFNFRFITGSRTAVSNHGKGRAIDLNPLYNPYVKGNKVSPVNGRKYAYKRDASVPYLIDKNDLAYKLFRQRGWRWGGDYRSLKDYQHFEKQ